MQRLGDDRAVTRLVRDKLPDWKVNLPPGGLSLWAELPAPVSNTLAATSERFGVRLAAGPRFGVDGAFERFMRLPYTLAPDDLAEVVDRLAMAYSRLRPGAVPSRVSTGAKSAPFSTRSTARWPACSAARARSSCSSRSTTPPL